MTIKYLLYHPLYFIDFLHTYKRSFQLRHFDYKIFINMIIVIKTVYLRRPNVLVGFYAVSQTSCRPFGCQPNVLFRLMAQT